MKKFFLLLNTILLSAILVADSISSYRCFELEGAKIIAEDGTFLGTLDDSYSADSIFNDYSDHGTDYSADSILSS